MGKSDCFGFLRKIYITLKMGEKGQILEPGVHHYIAVFFN